VVVDVGGAEEVVDDVDEKLRKLQRSTLWFRSVAEGG
jgi:hypothetical protein